MKLTVSMILVNRFNPRLEPRVITRQTGLGLWEHIPLSQAVTSYQTGIYSHETPSTDPAEYLANEWQPLAS